MFPAHVAKPLPSRVIDLSAVAELRGIARLPDRIRIGGATRWSEIVAADLPPAFDCLKAAAREVGSVQIQNRGTIAGNLCNASPAADGVPPLLALDAEVELTSVAGMRHLPLASFIAGYRATALKPGEILSAIVVPTETGQVGSAFVKLGSRRYMIISIVMAAAVLPRDAQGCIFGARIAVGAASAVAQRLPELEHALQGLPPGERPSQHVNAGHLRHLSPIDDVRATAAYRRDAAMTVVGEALDRAAGFTGHD